MKIYIAGKITGLVYEDALRTFAEAEALLKRLGHEPVNPMAKVSEQEGLTWAEYMKQDIPFLLECDAIYLLPNWRDSKGARLEWYIAASLGMQVTFAQSEEWIDCSAVGCGERFIQTDPDAEVDLCPKCEAALMKVAA
jgi:hypothetical protein